MKAKLVPLMTMAAVMLVLATACDSATSPTAAPTEQVAAPSLTAVEEIPATTTPVATDPTAATPATQATEPAEDIPLKDALPNLQPQDVFQHFYDITQIPRPSGQMDQIRAFLVDFGQGLGLETIVDDVGNVIIRKKASAGYENRPGVVLQAHMDMVSQKEDAVDFDFATDPIQAYVNGDTIVTHGTTLGADNGIGIAMIMALLQNLALQAGPLEALFTADEESTMAGANGLQPGVLTGSILINMDSEEEGIFTIGSAGGEHLEVSAPYAQLPAPPEMLAYTVKVQGLQGGHSGVDINKGLGHATKLLVRLLKGAEEPYGLRLASIAGGTAGNAIPRDATAVVFVPPDQLDAFRAYVTDYEATIQSELAAVEPGLNILLEAAEPLAQVMDQNFQGILLNALYGTPQGVVRMSDAVPGLVETSNNLGIVLVEDGQMQAGCYLRSSVDSALQDHAQMIASVWELAGYPVEISGAYSGWPPNPDSPILGLMQSTYKQLYGVEAEVGAVHAGLECGTFGSVYPGIDMISIGPTMQKVHSPSESLYIPSIEKVMDLLVATLQAIPEKK